MIQWLQALVDGILVGGVYAIVSSGLSLVFGIMGVVNFAHAEFLMVGMFVAWFAWAWLGIDPLLGSLIALVVVFALGAGIQRVLIRPILKAPQVAQIFLTVGLLFCLENGALLLFGANYRSVVTPYQTESLRLGPITVSLPYLFAFLMSGVSGGLLWAFLRFSRTGRAMRATALDPMAAKLVGIDTDRMHQIAFGLGSVAGAAAGGVAVGVIQALSALVFPVQLQNLVLFLVFIAVLAVRPQGLLKGASA